MKKRATIIGASGYTGAELLRLLSGHPHIEVTHLCADRKAGMQAGEVFAHWRTMPLPNMVAVEDVDWSQIDVAFCALPHGTSQQVIASIPEHVLVLDLSADFRLHDVADYQTWYGQPHAAPHLQQQAIYGLSELSRESITQSRIIACPGCYPTSILLPILPLLKDGIIEPMVIADSKSGTSGAGRGLKEGSLFCEVNESIAAYGVGKHRHMAEIEQEMRKMSGCEVALEFTPHLVPMNRGILSTQYLRLKPGKSLADARATLHAYYQHAAFVHLLDEVVAPATSMVRGSNHAVINLFAGRGKGCIIAISAIDNLVKGSAGQAVQNANIYFGFDEALGLDKLALFP